MRPAIVIADRDEAWRQTLKRLLLCDGFEVIEAVDTISILRALRQRRNLALLIVNTSLDTTGDGVELAQLLRQRDRTVSIIVLAPNSSEELAIAALKAGAVDYFKPPFSYEVLLASVRHCLADHVRPQTLKEYRKTGGLRRLPSCVGLEDNPRMVGESRTMREIKAYMARVASTDSNVLITGETGTGKELVADFLHRNSPRRQQPIVDINCAALPESLLESELFGYEKGAFTGAASSYEGKLKRANGGTVFFDEIGDMSPYTQAKILRVIERREVQRLGTNKSVPIDVRVISATNQNLDRLMTEGRFRKDLYFRLNVARIHLPPLRDRKEDIPLLLRQYIHEMNARFGREVESFSKEALERLLQYDWPGNVRELKNLVEAIFVNLPVRHLTSIDLPEPFRKQFDEATVLPVDERARLLSALCATNWNKSQAARKLNWSRVTLYRKIAKYHVAREERTQTLMETSGCGDFSSMTGIGRQGPGGWSH
jgi:DNA-binding NtrC family response regulator